VAWAKPGSLLVEFETPGEGLPRPTAAFSFLDLGFDENLNKTF
jgi:hypothetical protein